MNPATVAMLAAALALVPGCGGSGSGTGSPSDASGVGGAGGAEEHSEGGGSPDGSAGTVASAGSPSGSGGASEGVGGAEASSGGSAGGAAVECDDGTGWDAAWQQLECDAIALINEQRSIAQECDGLQPAVSLVARDQLLTEIARDHAQDMAARGTLDYANSDGEQWPSWIYSGGYAGSVRTSLIGQADPGAPVDMDLIMGDAMNCQALMTTGADQVGVGYSDGYWVAIFARGG